MNAVCEVCGAIGYEHLLLCCCDCKGARTHQYCLDKVLYDASLEDWFCDECNQRRNEGSYSRSLGKVSSERPSSHVRFDSTSQHPITKRLKKSKFYIIKSANMKKMHSSRVKSSRKKCIRKKSNMRGKGITEQSNLSKGQVFSGSKASPNLRIELGNSVHEKGGDEQKCMDKKILASISNEPEPSRTNECSVTHDSNHNISDAFTLEREKKEVRFQLDNEASNELQERSMDANVPHPSTLQNDALDKAVSDSKANFVPEASATEVEISDTVQNWRNDSPKKRRRLILIFDDDDEEEKAEDVQQENMNRQPLNCNDELMVKHRVDTEYYAEEAVQTGDLNDQNLMNGRPMKRRRDIAENENEEDMKGSTNTECALNIASKWSSNDSAKMSLQTAVATDNSLQPRPSDSEYANQQYHIYSQPLDEPVWSGVFKIDNEVIKLDAHLSNKACQRVCELSGLLQPVVEVTVLSRLKAWPERWTSSGPTHDSIGLFFFPHSSRQNEISTRLINRIIKSDDALKVTVGIAELLIFPSVLLPEQYHFFQGKHYLWGVFRRRNDILDNGGHVEEQDGSAHATGEGQHQEQDILDQQDEAVYALSDQETFSVKHAVNAEDQRQVESDAEPQKDTMKVATSEGITSLCSSWSPAKLDSSKAGSNSPVQPRTEGKLHTPGDMEQQEDFTSSPEWNASSTTKQSSSALPVEHGSKQAHQDSEPSTTKLFGFVSVTTPRSQQLIQEMVNEGALLFPVPEEIATTDSITCSVPGVVSSALNPDTKSKAPQAFDFVSVAEPGADSEACLELFPVRQEQIGWAPREEVGREVDLNLSLGKRPQASSLPPLL